MVVLSQEESVVLLEFAENPSFDEELKRLREKTGRLAVSDDAAPIRALAKEIDRYFKGDLKTFETPFSFEFGTPFQKRVWAELAKIPYGETRSYAEISLAIGLPRAIRAAARANGANPLAIVIPCHRVINSDGKLGGYGGGLERKKWLLRHERIL